MGTTMLYRRFRVGHRNICVQFEFNDIHKSIVYEKKTLLSIFYDIIAVKVIFLLLIKYVELIFAKNIVFENVIVCIKYNNILKSFKHLQKIFLNYNKPQTHPTQDRKSVV